VLGYAFDDTIVEPATYPQTPHSGMMVDLALAPALTKTGTADGECMRRLPSYLVDLLLLEAIWHDWLEDFAGTYIGNTNRLDSLRRRTAFSGQE
jgi:hypothetical protein